jgi:hypothetical protein
LLVPGAFDLPDFERDEFRRVIPDEARVAQAINEVFRAKVVWIAEASAEADNADANADCVASFSRRRCQGFIAKSRLRLGTGCRTTSLMPFSVAFDIAQILELLRRQFHRSLALQKFRFAALDPARNRLTVASAGADVSVSDPLVVQRQNRLSEFGKLAARLVR